MSHFLDNLTYFTREKPEKFSNGHGITTNEPRDWERAYRGRWSHDKVVRSTHGVNCTGSSRAAWLHGKPSRPIIHARGLICPTMNPVVARGAPVIPGTCTVRHV